MSRLDEILQSIEGSTVPTDRAGYRTIHATTVKAKEELKALFTELIDRVQISEELSPQAHLGKRACQMNLRELVNKL